VGLVVAIMGSDFFDGKIARKYHLVSKFGYVLAGELYSVGTKPSFCTTSFHMS
jgi:hypothetical protein